MREWYVPGPPRRRGRERFDSWELKVEDEGVACDACFVGLLFFVFTVYVSWVGLECDQCDAGMVWHFLDFVKVSQECFCSAFCECLCVSVGV